MKGPKEAQNSYVITEFWRPTDQKSASDQTDISSINHFNLTQYSSVGFLTKIGTF